MLRKRIYGTGTWVVKNWPDVSLPYVGELSIQGFPVERAFRYGGDMSIRNPEGRYKAFISSDEKTWKDTEIQSNDIQALNNHFFHDRPMGVVGIVDTHRSSSAEDLLDAEFLKPEKVFEEIPNGTIQAEVFDL